MVSGICRWQNRACNKTKDNRCRNYLLLSPEQTTSYFSYFSLQFQQMMDNLFLSFNGSISVNNFAELSACVFNWLEEYCKPQVSYIWIFKKCDKKSVKLTGQRILT